MMKWGSPAELASFRKQAVRSEAAQTYGEAAMAALALSNSGTLRFCCVDSSAGRHPAWVELATATRRALAVSPGAVCHNPTRPHTVRLGASNVVHPGPRRSTHGLHTQEALP